MAPGNQACGEGTFGTGQDVEAVATMEFGSMKLDVQAANKVWWPPIVKVFMNKEQCIVVQGDVGAEWVYDDGVLRYTVQRLADGQWKEFTITFTESVQPIGRLFNCVWDS